MNYIDVDFADDEGNHRWMQQAVAALNAAKDRYGEALTFWIDDNGHVRAKLESASPNLDLPII